MAILKNINLNNAEYEFGAKYLIGSTLPAVPDTPVAADEEIPYSWEEINAIALSGHATDWISVGAIKSVTLSEEVLGTTTHDVRVIGINQDNDQSITFQTKNCLNNTTAFGSSNALWIGSTLRSLCQSYYNAFPGKTSIKTVSKGTCASGSSSRASTVTYNDETVWLPSEREMGLDLFSLLSAANSTTSNAECTYGKNFSYSYYSSNASRVKKLGDSGSAQWYWERSLYYNGAGYACVVGSDGWPDGGGYDTVGGCAPAFVIGNEENFSPDLTVNDIYPNLLPSGGTPGQTLVRTSTGSAWMDTDIKLVSIAVEAMPTTTTYEYGDTLNTSGLTIRAYWSDETSNIITSGFTCSISTLNAVGTQTVTVYYTVDNITQSTIFQVTVNRKSVTKPTWKSNLTYSGSAQSVSGTSYWNNFNTSYMSISGTTSATNAGTYSATFTPGSNYRWADDTTSSITVSWTINKATGSLSLSTTSVAIDASNYSSGVAVTITRAGDGTISYSPTSISGLTMSLSGNVLTIKGNGSTAVAATTVTISVSAGTNYTAPSSKTLTVSATYWEWGSETATADTAWWAGLKTWIATASETELKDCLGKTKSVTLTTAVLGTTTHLVRCIGYNCDRDKNNPTVNTLTFQTANALATTTYFNNGNSSMLWSTAYIRTTYCAAYYNAFPGKDYIVTTSQGTCTSTNGSQTGTPTYFDETVFLPSDCQMGFLKGRNSSSGLGYAASYDEYDQYNTSKTSYQYYTSASSRIKKLGDSGSAQWYWERSLYYYNTDRACRVNSDGLPGTDRYSNVGGCAPAFAI